MSLSKYPLSNRAVAELIDTFWLALGGCGSAVLAERFQDIGIGLVGVSLAFGLTVVTMAYAIGHISGCHLNPAVSIGLAAGGRFDSKDLPAYIVAQIVGATLAAALLYCIAIGQAGYGISGGLAAKGYAEHSPDAYTLLDCFTTEVTMTAMFLFIIMEATDKHAPLV